ncbi:hypothetical protein ACFLZB_02275 [Nanoarchaeota archaeon]
MKESNYVNGIHAEEALRLFFKQGAYNHHSRRQMESQLLEEGHLQPRESGLGALIPLDQLSAVHASVMERYSGSPFLLEMSEKEWREKLGNPPTVLTQDGFSDSTNGIVTYWGIVDKIRNHGYLRDTAQKLIDENFELLGRGRWENGLRIFPANKVERLVGALATNNFKIH